MSPKFCPFFLGTGALFYDRSPFFIGHYLGHNPQIPGEFPRVPELGLLDSGFSILTIHLKAERECGSFNGKDRKGNAERRERSLSMKLGGIGFDDTSCICRSLFLFLKERCNEFLSFILYIKMEMSRLGFSLSSFSSFSSFSFFYIIRFLFLLSSPFSFLPSSPCLTPSSFLVIAL